MAAITSLDHRSLGTEYIDLLHNILPNEQEVKAFNNYESDGKPLAALSPTDQFLIQVSFTLHCHCQLGKKLFLSKKLKKLELAECVTVFVLISRQCCL